MKKANSFLLATAVLLLSASLVSAAELATAKIFSVTGPSTVYRADRTNAPAEKGDVLQQGDGVVAGPTATVVLAFSNGSMLTLEPRASVTLAEMSQEAFAGDMAYEALSADPSVSTNLIQLEYGNVNAEVKKLQPGSSFNIETALGTAAVRGTILNVVFYPQTSTSRAVAKIFVTEGTVFFDTFLDGEVAVDASGGRSGNFSPNGEPASVEVSAGNPLMIYGLRPRDVFGYESVFTPLHSEFVSPEGPDDDDDDDDDDIQ